MPSEFYPCIILQFHRIIDNHSLRCFPLSFSSPLPTPSPVSFLWDIRCRVKVNKHPSQNAFTRADCTEPSSFMKFASLHSHQPLIQLPAPCRHSTPMWWIFCWIYIPPCTTWGVVCLCLKYISKKGDPVKLLPPYLFIYSFDWTGS